MSHYSIRDLQQLSNVKTHTIRVWEQRYNLLQPERTDTNIRYYDDEQLKKLLNVSVLMNNGMKISKISKLNNKEIADEIEKLLSNAIQFDNKTEALLNQCIIAATSFDEALFEKIINGCIHRDGLIETYKNVVYPLLMRIGQLWTSNEMLPAQEHFISNLLEKKLYAAIDALPLPVDADQTWILFLREPEEHVLGLLLTYYILKKHGKKVVYLGRRVPVENLFNVVKECNATHIYTFFVKNRPERETAEFLNQIKEFSKKLKVFISGRAKVIENIPLNSQVVWLKEVDSLIEILKR